MIPALKQHPTLPLWWEYGPESQHDPRERLPPLPRKRRFETEADAERENTTRIERLQAGDQADRKLADKMCPEGWDGSEPCLLPSCFHCARRFRLWRVSEQLRLFDGFEDDELFVVHLLFPEQAVPFGELNQVDLKAIKDTLYHQINRVFVEQNGLQPVISGQLEVGAVYGDKKMWLPHAHLPWANCTRKQLKKLRRLYRPWNGWTRLMKVQQPKSRVRAVNYAGKFSTMYRPLRQTGPAPSKGVRLPRAQETELLHFLAEQRFEDFLFNFNVRRIGADLRLTERVEYV